ncbi:uncharacterized protein LOC114257061 [Camellia sinensis]|uniref:uncharacterized protein LOC114257061 n=1 Tax=Camellia sinensis TaxID=4442 RepID=UPI0010365001|nr:uncharacterized protein LOC114257061 [Camellia sinensis]
MVLLQETKKEVINAELVNSIWVGEKMEFMSVDSVGVAGGLLCIWNPEVFQLKECCCNHNFILLVGSIFFNFNYVIVNVYGPNDPVGRKCVWDIFVKLKTQFLAPWCMEGDFNEIISISERKCCSKRDKGMREFNDMIEQLEVSDLPMYGKKFKWCNSHKGDRWSRIDKFLLNPEWLQIFNFKLWGLPRVVSDHCPTVLMENERVWGLRPFRFICAWFLHPKFVSFVEQTWADLNVIGWAGFRCLVKLKALKSTPKNFEVFGNVVHKLKATENATHAFDLVAEDRLLSAHELARKRELKGEAWQLGKMLERMWCRSNRNALCSIMVSGITIEDPLGINAEMLNHFSNFVAEPWLVRPTLNGPFKAIGDGHELGFLEADFSEEEIKCPIKSCEGNKAPRPDGFNMGFFSEMLEYSEG